MKRLLFVIIAAALFWSGYWFIGSSGANKSFKTWFEDRRAEGWLAEYSDISTIGFPSRFDTTISELQLADPDSGLAYSAPFVQIFALSYKPEHLIAVWPHEQSLSTPYGKVAITSTDMRASLIVEKSAKLALDRTHFTSTELAFATDDGRTFKAAQLNAAVEQTPTAPNSYHFGIDAQGLSLPQPRGMALNTGGVLPDTFERARADMTVTFDAPWDIAALQTARPQPRQINLKLIEARWGQLDLRLAGELEISPAGTPTGRITIKARNWRDMLTLASASGYIPQQFLNPLEQGLSLLSSLSGNRQTLDMPLDFANGRMMLGPIPLGPAPILKLR